jgi:phosphoribosylformylglycinamidine synthase subunit PurL
MTSTLEITDKLVADHGLSPEEYQSILKGLGRTPTLTELGIFSAMWSEHCSYKSSRRHLSKLPTQARRDAYRVIQGPGENAGVIDIGDGWAAIFKMESHNHPSYIEPYQGAATGVGGILRDVFTMGARPVANMNALRFGEPEHPKTRHFIAGVVAGIGGYGNCVGVPTVGGEVSFHEAYNGNILVNAMTVGLARADKIFYSAAAGIGNAVVYVGAKTGRDGIHGATMSSAEFSADTKAKRPTVQVGDPFTEKLLIEACLELMASDAIVAIQDMGAAGLTSASVEMASKGQVGIVLDLDQVPCREQGMTPYEMMLSESQERMLMILRPGREAYAQEIFTKWGLDFAVIGTLVAGDALSLRFQGLEVANIPLGLLSDEAPQYDRPSLPPPAPRPLDTCALPLNLDDGAILLQLLGSPNLASRRWIWEQYDHEVMGDTLQHPGGDAAVIRVHGTSKALAISTDCTPRYCAADPVLGGMQAVAECWRNLTAVGALPLALTNCLNFASPQRPEVMGSFIGCLEGMAAACSALDFPVISGNVSLYNESKSSPDAKGQGVLPTPSIGGVGIIEDAHKHMTLAFKQEGAIIYLLGTTLGHLGQSVYLREIAGVEAGPPPPVELAQEKRVGDSVRAMIEQGLVTAVHDVSEGGVAIALAEMAMAGGMGCVLDALEPHLSPTLSCQAFLFGEDQARYVVTTQEEAALLALCQSAGITALRLGVVGTSMVTIANSLSLDLRVLKAAHEAFFPSLMAG